jgi:hypothetical protein
LMSMISSAYGEVVSKCDRRLRQIMWLSYNSEIPRELFL